MADALEAYLLMSGDLECDGTEGCSSNKFVGCHCGGSKNGCDLSPSWTNAYVLTDKGKRVGESDS
jgi:hypothetical protein